MRVLIISDTWHPEINGVVRTLEETAKQLRRMGHEVEIVGPEPGWRTFSAPAYPNIKLEFFARARLRRILENFNPEGIHIATEGPLGWAARNLCLYTRKPFTTAYHTRFPEYLAARTIKILQKPVEFIARTVLRHFHAPSCAVMVATASIENELRQREFRHIVRWSRGVDTVLFKPRDKNISTYAELPHPILLYVGRVAIEKNLHAFLSIDCAGSKVVIGDGPDLEFLKNKYPAAVFLGPMEGEELARHYAAADLFVFPSQTDTFGLVLLEAAASGLRIASYPAPGPIDLFSNPTAEKFTALDADLGEAVQKALALPDNPTAPQQFAEGFSWQACTQQFLHHLTLAIVTK